MKAFGIGTILCVALLVVGVEHKVSAQSTGFDPSNMRAPLNSSLYWHSGDDEKAGGDDEANRLGENLRRAAAMRRSRKASANSGTTTFRPAAGTIVPQQMAMKLAKTPQERQELEQAFTNGLNYYKDLARANGVALNDVARAVSFYIEANYITYSGGKGLTPAQGRGMRETIRASLVESEKFQAMSAREKQKMYEMMAIMGAYVVIGHDAAEKKGDSKAAAEFQQLAKENLEHLLGSIDKVSFTDTGVAFK